ncbi:hypothetical protein AKJ51_02960 [candidate division MSBL1 archaeon SCGC-AAA382A20]|uniref:SF3 helicase domain-containing protein n=1 Tax=candidate division MSBL1 archaeon SCGC-AAA382A20 TaxID=1698280 RepID=A0A133VJW2_9EURY|nr:hypothetical protein AKJ51_02960 [candidate division MSBL1 archaeon SCGC-AAA382A20]
MNILVNFVKSVEDPVVNPNNPENEEFGPFEEGEQVFLPEEVVEIFLENNQATKHGWKCLRCGEVYLHQEEKPKICQNPNCGKKGPFRSLHPTEHHEIGNLLIDEYSFKTMNTTEQIYHFNGSTYFENKGAESLIKGKTKEIVPNCKSRLQNEVVEHIKTSTYEPTEKFGLSKEKIAVENGILDIEKEELVELNPEEEIPITKIPVKFDPEAKCPKILEFIEELVDEEDVDLIQEMFGYCLWKDYPIARAFMLKGSGANGKSTLLGLLERFLGKENIATPSLQKLLENDFASIRLYGKLANIRADLSDKKLEQTGGFKMLTGQDLIEGEQKWVQETLDFYNHAKLIYSANELPKTDDRTEAFFRRWIIIPFENHFPEDDPDTDPNILEKIITEEEMSGLLNWALKGLKRVLEQGKFSETQSREEKMQKWFMDSDSLRAFVKVALEKDSKGSIAKKDLQNLYEAFCEHHGIYVAQKGQVTKRLRSIIPAAKGGSGEWYRPEVGDDRPRCWENITVKEEFLEKDYVQDVRVTHITSSNYVRKDCKIKKSSSENPDKSDISAQGKEILRLLKKGEAKPPEEIADELDMQLETVKDCLDELFDARLVEKGGEKIGGGMLYRVVKEEVEKIGA